VCGELIGSAAPALELAFNGESATSGALRFPLHHDCFAAWEFERRETTARLIGTSSRPHWMLWRNPPSYPFDTSSVRLNAPQEAGIYALRSPTRWVYVGESDNIRAQLIQHLNGDNACITVHPSLTFSYELVPDAIRAWRQDELVSEFRPICNPRPG